MSKVLININNENKSNYVNNLFTKISKKYDLLNNLMTFGMHLSWKKDALKLALSELNNCQLSLDLCSGTGDLSILLNDLSPDTNIIATDNCNSMLEVLYKKISKNNIKNIQVKKINAEDVDFSPHIFDLITIGFGLRNLVNKKQCIESVYRVLKPGGVFMCIDLGHPENPIWKSLFFSYFYKFIPFLGRLFAKNEEAYTYLPESLKSWYTQEELNQILLEAGFKKSFYKNIFGGVVAIHVAIR